MHRYLISYLISYLLLTGCGNQTTSAPPPEFADFPLYPNAQEVDYTTSYGPGTLTFTISGSVNDLNEWYRETLGQRGWTVDSSESSYRFQGQAVLTVKIEEPTETQDGRRFDIYMTPDDVTVDVLVDASTYHHSIPKPGP